MEDSNSMWMDIADNDFNNAIETFDIESQMELYQSPFHSNDVSNSFSNSNTNQSTFQSSSPYQPQSRPFTQQNYPSQAPRTNEIDEEYLVTLDSDTFQDYIHQIRKQRSLTRNEEQIVKRLVKKIKNRESARKSRQAKKEISQELDEQVLKLTEQTQNMKLELSALYATNQQIKNEISFSEKLIASNPFLAKLYAKALKGEQSPMQNQSLKMEFNSMPHNFTNLSPSPHGVAVHS